MAAGTIRTLAPTRDDHERGLTWDGEPSFEVPEGLPELEDPAFERRRAERAAAAEREAQAEAKRSGKFTYVAAEQEGV